MQPRAFSELHQRRIRKSCKTFRRADSMIPAVQCTPVLQIRICLRPCRQQQHPNAVFLFCFRFSFYSLFLFVYFNYAAAFGNACLYGLRSDFGLMFRVQPFRKPNDMLIQCKNRTSSFIIGLCSVIHAVKQEHRPVEFKRKLHRLRIG